MASTHTGASAAATNDGYINLDNINEASFPQFEIHLEFAHGYELLTIHPLEFARQATLMESELYKQIQPNELINLGWTKENKSELSPNVMRCIYFWDRFTYWYAKCIVDTLNLDERCAVVHRILDIASHFWEFNNFSGLKQIYAALETSSVARLEVTKEKVDIENHPIYEKFSYLFDDHEAGYFERLKNCNPPCVPFIGAHLALIFKKHDYHELHEDKQQQHIQELQQLNASRCGSAGSNSGASSDGGGGGNLSSSSSSSSSESRTGTVQQPPTLISFSKYRRLVDFVTELLQYQNISYKFRVHKQIRSFIHEDIELFIQKATNQSFDEDISSSSLSANSTSSSSNQNASFTASIASYDTKQDQAQAIQTWLYKKSKQIEPEAHKCNMYPRLRKFLLKTPVARNLKSTSTASSPIPSTISTSTIDRIERSSSSMSTATFTKQFSQSPSISSNRHGVKQQHLHQPHHKKTESLGAVPLRSTSTITSRTFQPQEKLSVSSSADSSAPNSPPPNYDDVFQTTNTINSSGSSPTLNTTNCFDNYTYFVRSNGSQIELPPFQLEPSPSSSSTQSASHSVFQRRSMASTISLIDYPLNCPSSSSSPKASSANTTTKQTTVFNFPSSRAHHHHHHHNHHHHQHHSPFHQSQLQTLQSQELNQANTQSSSPNNHNQRSAILSQNDNISSSPSLSSIGPTSPPPISLQPPPSSSNRNRKQS